MNAARKRLILCIGPDCAPRFTGCLPVNCRDDTKPAGVPVIIISDSPNPHAVVSPPQAAFVLAPRR
jgi:F420-dependent methylenetetrahydromethanopterin dehydrogenase